MLIRMLMACLLLAGSASADVSLRLNTDKTFQTIDGFGTCLITWQADHAQLYRTDAFADLYIDTLGFTMLRVNLWGETLPVPVEVPAEITADKLNLKGKAARFNVFLEFGAKLKQRVPDATIIGTVWSPPPWMKLNDALTDIKSGAIQGNSYERDGRVFDNRLDMNRLQHFAHWVIAMVQLCANQGMPFDAVSIGNEVMFTQPFESCVWTAKDYAAATAAVRRTLDAAGLDDLRTFGPETMTQANWSIANPLYIKELTAVNGPDILATHGYTDGVNPDASADSNVQFHKIIAHTGKPYWLTEFGTGSHTWPEALSCGRMFHNALVHGHASAILPWQVSDREANTHGLTVMGKLTPKSHVVRHFSKFIRPGAVRVELLPSDRGSGFASAYLHSEQKTLVIVLGNDGATAEATTIHLGGLTVRAFTQWRTDGKLFSEEADAVAVTNGAATLTLPGPGMVTLVGQID